MDSEYHSTAQIIKLKKQKWQKKAYYRFSHDLQYNQKEVHFSWAWVGLERKWSAVWKNVGVGISQYILCLRGYKISWRPRRHENTLYP